MDYNKFTIKQLKEKLRGLGYKTPSSFRKAEIIKYYKGALEEKRRGITPYNYNQYRSSLVKFTPVKKDDSLGFKEHLFTHGWTVTKIPNFNAKEIRKEFLQWIGRACKDFDPEDSSTWTKYNIPYRDRGILRRWVGHTDFMWKTRLTCVPVFEKIWQTKDLLLLTEL
jgi:hypothetical protein